MRSMTGFGRSFLSEDGRELTIEIKSVNSRYLDTSFRSPRICAPFEDAMRGILVERLNRGKVDVYITYRNRRDDHAAVVVDESIALSYQKALKQLSEVLNVTMDTRLGQFASFPQVLTLQEAEDDETVVESLLLRGLNDAVSVLIEMREREGARIHNDLVGKIANVREMVNRIEAIAPRLESASTERLCEKMKEFMEISEDLRQRVLAEAALIADKRAIDEEIVRLNSHLAAFSEEGAANGPIGRKLDFIVQEMNREVNTIGSKANDKEVGAIVISLKSEIEKIREQVQNIE